MFVCMYVTDCSLNGTSQRLKYSYMLLEKNSLDGYRLDPVSLMLSDAQNR